MRHQLRVEMLLKAGALRSFDIRKGVVTIGRDDDCSLLIDDPNVSRKHAELFVRGKDLIIRDSGSLNGVKLNGVRTSESALHNGDSIKLGDYTIKIQSITALPNPEESTDEIIVHSDGTTGVMEVIRAINVDQFDVTEDAGPQNSTLISSPEDLRENQRKLNQAYANMLSIMNFVSTVGTYSHPKQICEQFVTTLRRVFTDIDNVIIVLVDRQNRDQYVPIYEESLDAKNKGLHAPSRTVLERVINELRALYAIDAHRDPRFARSDSVRGRGVRSLMSAPLVIRGEAIGAIYIENLRQPYVFGHFDLNLLMLFSFHLANALETARLLQERDLAFEQAVNSVDGLKQNKTAVVLQYAQSEKKFRALFEQSAIGAAVIDLDTLKITEVNDGLVKMLGYSRQQLSMMTLRSIWANEEVSTIAAWLQSVRQNGQGIRKTALRTNSGAIITTLQSCRTLGINNDSVMVANYIDISAQERAEQELRIQLGRVTALSEFSEAIMKAHHPDAIGELLFDKLKAIMPVQNLVIAFIDEVSSDITPIYIAVPKSGDKQKGRYVSGVEQIRRLFSMEPFIDGVPGNGSNSRIPRLYIPIKAREDETGFVLVEGEKNSILDRSHLDTARALAAQASLALMNAEAFEEIRAQQVSLRQLSLQTMTVQEAERARISRELHDGVGQQLTAMKYILESLRNAAKNNDGTKLLGRIDEARELATQLIDDLRSISLDLRPTMLDDLGLEPTLIWFTKRFSEQTGIKTKLNCRCHDAPIPGQVATNIYRVIQEALGNVAKHSGAQNVIIEGDMREDWLRITIEDDGRGFPLEELRKAQAERGCSGIINMKERVNAIGGEFALETSPGDGTRLTLRIPMLEHPF